MKIKYPLVSKALKHYWTHNKSLEELKAQFEEFVLVKNERINFLFESALKKPLSYDIKSLQSLYYFLSSNIIIEDLTDHELAKSKSELPEHLRKIAEIRTYKIVEPSLSMIFDVGVYFGECLINENQKIGWFIEKDESSADYGKFVLRSKSEKVQFVPIEGIKGIIHQIVEGSNEQEDRFVSLFKTWKDSFEGKHIDYLAMINSWKKNG